MATHHANARPSRDTTPKPCIFCGAGKLSREHFYPEWAWPQLTSKKATHFSRRTFVGSEEKLFDRRQGDITSISYRVVCKPCNEGWMSRLEQSAKPLIQRLWRPGGYLLGRRGQETLAVYFALKAMISDNEDRTKALIAQAERTAFFRDRTLPQGLKITLGFLGDTNFHLHKVVHAVAFPAPAAARRSQTGTNCKSITFAFGNMLIQATYVTDLTPAVSFDYSPAVMEQFWPPRKLLRWPLPQLSRDQTFWIQHALRDAPISRG